MNADLLEQLYKKILELEKKIEYYYDLFKVENEISFILNGTYIQQEDVDKILNGTY